jgi:hypothetical protein
LRLWRSLAMRVCTRGLSAILPSRLVVRAVEDGEVRANDSVDSKPAITKDINTLNRKPMLTPMTRGKNLCCCFFYFRYIGQKQVSLKREGIAAILRELPNFRQYKNSDFARAEHLLCKRKCNHRVTPPHHAQKQETTRAGDPLHRVIRSAEENSPMHRCDLPARLI